METKARKILTESVDKTAKSNAPSTQDLDSEPRQRARKEKSAKRKERETKKARNEKSAKRKKREKKKGPKPKNLKPQKPKRHTEVRAMRSNAPQRIDVIASSCSLCGSEAVVYDEVDEVVGEQPLQLGECLHCEHRWTQPVGVSDTTAAPKSEAPESSPAIAGVRLPPKVPNAA